MENEFYHIMKVLSDEELQKRYLNKSEYNEEAIRAMEVVLQERNLIEQVKVLVDKKQQVESLSKEEEYNHFQVSEFGKVISDSDYVKGKLTNSIYFQKFISPLHNYGWAYRLFVILGIIGVVFSIIIFGIGELRPPFNYMLMISVFLAILLPFGIWKMAKNKTQIIIINEGRNNFLEIKSSKENYKIQFPFQYNTYWKWEYIKLNLKQVKLVLYVFDDNTNTVFELNELQVLYKSPPPHWDKFPSNISSEFKDKQLLGYSSYGTQKPFLYELHKIISGLE